MEKIIKEIINDPELNNYNENEKTFLFNFIIIINNYFVNITYKYYKYYDINFFFLHFLIYIYFLINFYLL